MKICALFVLSFLLIPFVSHAQQTGASPVEQNPVTRQEFEKKLRRLQKKIDKGAQDTKQQIQKTQQNQNQLQTDVRKIEANQAIQSNDLTTFKGATERNFHRITMTMIIVLAGVGLVFSGALWYVLRARKGQNMSPLVSQAVLINPDVPTLQKVRLETGRLRIPFILRLQSNPERGHFEEGDFPCTAIFHSADDPKERPLVLFDREEDPMAFEMARSHAVMLARQAKLVKVH